MPRWLLVLPLLAAVPQTAHALQPAKHRKLAEAACSAARLPYDFCRRMGKAVYETDSNEWDDLAAHAQSARNQDRCTAADAAVTRVTALARSFKDATATFDLERAAIDLGRALHTIQDECAHHGMTNEEHAHLSLQQTCSDEDTSPDLKPEAIACAVERSAIVLNAARPFLATINDSHVGYLCRDFTHEGNQDACSNANLPSPHQACEFLALYDDWSGIDSTWRTDLVGPALLDAFSAGLRGEPATRSMCGGNPAAIDPRTPHAPVSQTDITCTLTDIGCLGKVDSDVSPYGENDEPATSGGCNSSRSNSIALLVLVVLILACRRRALQ